MRVLILIGGLWERTTAGVVEVLKGGGPAAGGRGREMRWRREVGLVKLEWRIVCSAICTEWGWPCIGIDMGDAILVVLHSKGSGRCRLRGRERRCSLRAIRTVTIVSRESVEWEERKAVICPRLPLFCAGAWQCRQTGGKFYVGNVAMGHGWSIPPLKIVKAGGLGRN